MKYLLLGAVMWFCLAGLRAAESGARLEDPGQLLSSEAPWLTGCERGLSEFENKHGIRILVRYHLKSPSEAEDKKPGAYMHALAEKLGVNRTGVLIVYFNDDPDWRVWIGDDLVNVFTGKAGTVQELTASETIHNVKEAMLTAAHSKAKAELERARKSVPEGKPVTLAKRLALETDSLLGALKARLKKE